MAASFSDMALLNLDSNFQGRVASALWQTCVAISNEAWASIHASRKAYVVQVLNSPTQYKPLFVNVVSVDANCIADATQGGTVVLTSGNAAAQAALVTDAHISSAISAAFNSFINGV